jgi:hypothetical protein
MPIVVPLLFKLQYSKFYWFSNQLVGFYSLQVFGVICLPLHLALSVHPVTMTEPTPLT